MIGECPLIPMDIDLCLSALDIKALLPPTPSITRLNGSFNTSKNAIRMYIGHTAGKYKPAHWFPGAPLLSSRAAKNHSPVKAIRTHHVRSRSMSAMVMSSLPWPFSMRVEVSRQVLFPF